MQYYNIKYITRAAKSSLICKALLKYGYSSFKLEILEYCDPSLVIEREQYFIDPLLFFFIKKKLIPLAVDLLKPEYNILQVAGSLFGYKHTPESLEKMREIALNRSDETKAKLREAALGKTYKHTEETKIKLRDAVLGKKHSDETKAKLRVIQSTRIKHLVAGFKIEVKDVHTGQILYYDSLRAAGKELNTNHVTLSYNLNKGKLFRDRYLITKIISD
jgi:group I intron endonuclease